MTKNKSQAIYRYPKGFIYVVTTVGRNYMQPQFYVVPTSYGGMLYFGPCKIPMRPRMQCGDYIFGISPSTTWPRRIVFVVRITEKMSFKEAYLRFPQLHGPSGPIHVRPVNRPDLHFPKSDYEHIPGANHGDDWVYDLKKHDLDVFFVCEPAINGTPPWLGPNGPIVDDVILNIFKTCSVWGNVGFLSNSNDNATFNAPVRYGNLYSGLHLETDVPGDLVALCSLRTKTQNRTTATVSNPGRTSRRYDANRPIYNCRSKKGSRYGDENTVPSCRT